LSPKQASKKRKFRTGFCLNGWCEGTKPRSASGKPVPTCKDIERCPCNCHEILDEIFERAGRPRILVDNPDYMPSPRTWWMPGDDDTGDSNGLSTPDGIGTLDRPERPPMAPSRPGNGASVARTATGRRAKGSLEHEVLAVCTDWSNDVFDWDSCTPKLVAEEIGAKNAEENPSTGAIQAVWDRWVKLEFAVYEKKPVRFGKFLLEDFSVRSLETLKRAKKRQKSQAKRGIR
jgi:hypothetical protein